MYCINPECPAKVIGQILYFVSRDAVNIDWIGDSFAELLVKQGIVKTIADLYTLDDSQIRLQLLAMAGI